MQNKNPEILYIFCNYCDDEYETCKFSAEEYPEYCMYCGNTDIKIKKGKDHNQHVRFSER